MRHRVRYSIGVIPTRFLNFWANTVRDMPIRLAGPCSVHLSPGASCIHAMAVRICGSASAKSQPTPWAVPSCRCSLKLEAKSCMPVVEPSTIRPAEDGAIPLAYVPVTSVSSACQPLGECARSKARNSRAFQNAFPRMGIRLQQSNTRPSRHKGFRHPVFASQCRMETSREGAISLSPGRTVTPEAG